LLQKCRRWRSGTLLRSRLAFLALLPWLALSLALLPLLRLVGRLFLLAERAQCGLRDSFAGGHNGGRGGAFQHIHDFGRGFAGRGVF
jgi:hypothetical protein